MALPVKHLAILAAAWLAVPTGLAFAQEPQPSAPTGTVCGGIAGFGCPEGSSCIDDPRDDCDPSHGGADCSGICTTEADAGTQAADGGTQEMQPRCDYEDPNLRYVSKDPEQCSAIRFVCDTGQEAFFNDCGCGCRSAAP